MESISALAYALEDCEVAYAVAASKVDRLLAATFDNAPRARETLRTLLRQRGTEGAIRVLEDGRVFGREWHFGTTQERFLLWGSAERVNQALAELPNAIRDQEELAAKLADLRQAHRVTLDRDDRDRFGEAAVADRRPDRNRSRN